MDISAAGYSLSFYELDTYTDFSGYGRTYMSNFKEPEASWDITPPHLWTKDQVWQWLQFCCDQYKLDAHSIPFQRFNMEGHELCSMSEDNFKENGIHGEQLFRILQAYRLNDLSTIQDLHMDDYCGPERSVEPVTPRPCPKVPLEQRKNCTSNLQLWEFVRNLLLNPNQDILEWEDKESGIFRVLKSEKLAQRWGQAKRNGRMNYEKLSRALRHYYKTGILERVDRRLVYKFGKKAHGWREGQDKGQ
ncbi:ETS-related transcription factor Elf-5-like [Polypterus senegalus]